MDARRQIGETKAKARKIFVDTAEKATRGEYVTPPEFVPGLMSEQEQRNLRMIRDKKYNFLFLDTTKSFNSMYHKNFNNLQLTTSMDDKMDWG